LSGTAAIDQGYVKSEQIPTRFRPSNAVQDLALLRGKEAVATIPAGQVVVEGLFVSPSTQSGTVAGGIPPGEVAVTISVDPVHEVGGLVQPGDQVDIMIELSGGARGAGVEQFLYQNVRVYAVGTELAARQSSATVANSSSTTSAPTANSNLVTVVVPPDAAERIALAEEGGGGVTAGSIYLALVPPGTHAQNVPPIDGSNLMPPTNTPS
jgi:Flp pilus assembly protein CpaB